MGKKKLTDKELKDLLGSAINGLEVARILLNLEPEKFEQKGYIHTVLEDAYEKVQKIALEYCAYD